VYRNDVTRKRLTPWMGLAALATLAALTVALVRKHGG